MLVGVEVGRVVGMLVGREVGVVVGWLVSPSWVGAGVVVGADDGFLVLWEGALEGPVDKKVGEEEWRKEGGNGC